jgi:hypothetical protein
MTADVTGAAGDEYGGLAHAGSVSMSDGHRYSVAMCPTQVREKVINPKIIAAAQAVSIRRRHGQPLANPSASCFEVNRMPFFKGPFPRSRAAHDDSRSEADRLQV